MQQKKGMKYVMSGMYLKNFILKNSRIQNIRKHVPLNSAEFFDLSNSSTEVYSPRNHSITASQNGRGWKEPLWVI